jgi:hypothetical protein
MTESTPKRSHSTGFVVGCFIAVIVIVIVMVIAASSFSGQRYSRAGTAKPVHTNTVAQGDDGGY